MKRLRHLLAGLAALALGAGPPAATPARAEGLLDLCDVLGVRDNQLVGYGVVTGLNGTGDDMTAPFAQHSLRALLRRLGVQADARQLRLKNVAAVLVTATLPPFSRSGSRLDVTVSSIGNAKSLRGGVLVQTPLRGADRHTYAVAQGPLLVGGFSASGASGSSVLEGTTTTARLPAGALVEREVPTELAKDGLLTLVLREPGFATAARVVTAVDGALGKGAATAVDGGAVRVKLTGDAARDPVSALARMSAVTVDPVAVARVVVNERTGTIVAGGDVRLMPVAIAQGGITISVRETPRVSQPEAFAGGTTQVVPDSEVEPVEQGAGMTFVNGATTLADVAQALSALGVTPRELGSILQALRTAGALRAEVVVQ